MQGVRGLDVAALRAWCHAAVADLARVRDVIDELNVFPVADADTGANMHRTMVAATEAADEAVDGTADEAVDGAAPDVRAAWTATARAAMLGAQGNSGVILSQLLRGLAEHAPTGGAELARALRHAVDLAYAAVGEPVEGTMLTVAHAAAASAVAAASGGDDSPHAVAAASARGARDALPHTPDQLSMLAEAGVVDAGAAGLVVVLEALARVCGGADPAVDHVPDIPARRPGAHRPPAVRTGPAYEVMYLLDAPADAIGPLRRRLGSLGDSLVVAGGVEDGWSVHVHVDDVGSAVLAGVDAGRPHRIRVSHLGGADHAGTSTSATRHILALVPTAELRALVETSGARAVCRPDEAALADAVSVGPGVEAALVPDSAASAAVAAKVARRWRDAGARVAVVPSRSVVQLLAAVAVHDPEVAWEDGVTAMTAAATATRYADIPSGATDAAATAVTATRALVDGAGGTLVTLVHGPATPPGLVDAVVDALADAAPDVETAVYAGGPQDLALVVGVE